MTNIVVSQPMFFPWAGLFEQVRLADVFVHYDDVALPQGRSFISRVQIKTRSGQQWLTVPVRRDAKLIVDVKIEADRRWREKHLRTLRMEYANAPHCNEMLAVVESVYAKEHDSLADLNIDAIERVAGFLGLAPRFIRSSSLGTTSHSSQKLFDLVKMLEGDVYITGHGARNYLDHALFEAAGVRVEYMDYRKVPYPQLNGDFQPFVSILDAIANIGTEARAILQSPSVDWKSFLSQ